MAISAAASRTEVTAGTNVASVDQTTGADGQDIYEINADGASVSAGSGAVDVTAAAPDANNVTDYVVDLSQASKDSLTLADSALQTVVTQIDGTEVKTLDQNDNVANFISGQNIELSDNGGAIEIATADNVIFTDVQTDTLTAGPINIGAGGIDAGNTTISNLADGVNAQDAVNVSQLENSAAASRTEVIGGTNIASVGQTTGADGQDIYTVNADGASVSAGSGAVDVTAAAPDANNVTDYAVDLSQASKDSLTLADSALQTVVTQIDGTEVKTLDENDNVANFVTGDNIVLSDEAGGIKIATSPDLTADSLTINNGPTLNDNGIDMGGDTITNLGAPVNGGDAVNLDYFDENRSRYYSVNDNGTQQGNYDNDGAAGINALAAGTNALADGNSSVAMGDGARSASIGADQVAVGTGALAGGNKSIAIGQGARAATDLFDGGIEAVAIGSGASAQGTGNVALGSDSFADGSTLATAAYQPLDANGNPIAVAAPTAASEMSVGAAGDERRITNVAAGAEDTDAVNVSQLKAVNEVANTGWNLSAQDAAAQNVAPGDEVNLRNSDGNLVITQATDNGREEVTFNLNDDVVVNNSVSVGSVVTDATTNDITGLSNTDLTDPGFATAGRAATEEQLAISAAASRTEVTAGTNVASVDQTTGADGQDIYTVNADGASVSAGSGAVDVTAAAPDADNVTDYAVDLSQASKDSLTLADSALQTVVTQIDGTVVKTIDQNDNVANFISGDNIELSDLGGAIEIATSPNLTADSLAINNGPTLNDNGIDMGGNTITNLGDPVNAGDALNLKYFDENRTRYYSVNDDGVIQGNYENDGATGVNAMAAGVEAISTGENNTAVGFNSQATGANDATAVGANALASAPGSTSLGQSSTATGSIATAIGTRANASGSGSSAIGSNAQASGTASVALGRLANAAGEDAVAIGNSARSDYRGTAVGPLSEATGDNATATGFFSKANGYYAASYGSNSKAEGDLSLAMGGGSQATAANSVALGSNSLADGSILSTAAYQPLDGEGNPIAVAAPTADSEVSVGSAGNERRITNVAAGATDTDAVNVSQLKAVNEVASAGWNVQTNGDAATNVAPGDTVQFIDGKNIDITRNGADITVATADSVVFDDVTITGGPTLTGGGIDMNATTISNLADGVNANDAVNLSQLENSAAASKTEVAGGTNVASVDKATGVNGQDIYTVNADGASVSAGSGAVDVTAAAPDANNVTDYAVDLSQASKDSLTLADSALQTVVTQIDGTDVKTLDENDNVANFVTGDNIVLSDEAGGIKIATSADLTADSLTINNGPTLNDNGIDMGGDTITNLGDPVNGGDAINLDYFDENRAHYYSVNDGGTIGGNYNNDGATGLNAIASGVNATASGDGAVAMGFGASAPIRDSLALGSGSVVDRALAPDSGFIPAGSATIEFNTTDKELLGAISVGDDDSYRQITNVADGTEAQDAVTVRQLQGAVGSVITTGIKYYRANSDDPDAIAAGEDSLAIGPNTVTNGDNGIGMGNGAIVGQMAPGGTAIGNNAEVMLSDGIAFGTHARSEAQQGIALGAGATVSHDQSVALGSNSVTEDAVATSGVTIAGDSYTFAGTTPDSTVSIGSAGNERTLTNVAAGRVSETSTDAINGSQLFASNQAIEEVSTIANTGWDLQTNGDAATNVAPGDTVQMLDGQNIAITRNGTDITVATVDSPQFGNVTVNTGGGDTINGLSNLTFDPDNYTSGQAASEDQLKQVSDIANTGWNVQANGDTATNVAPGDTVQFIDGKNIDITRNGADITVATADSVVFDDVTITGGPTLTGGGIDMNATTISNLADGVNAQDAVNLSQLENAAAASKTEVTAGTNVASVDQTTGADGQDIYTVNADGASVSAGSGAVEVTAAAPDANNVTDYAVDLSQASKDSLTLADSALQTVVTQIDGTEVKTLDQNDNVANFVTGDNIVLSDEAGGIKIATADDVTFTSINSDSLAITGGPTLTGGGIDMNNTTISNLADGVNAQDAVNLSQLENSAAASRTEVTGGTNIASVDQTTGTDGQDIYTVNADGASVSAGSGAVDVTAAAPDANNITDYAVDLSQASKDSLTLADSALQTVVTQIDGTEVKTLDQNDNVANFVTGDNIVLSDEAGGIKIATSPDLTADSLTINNGGPTLNDNGIDMGGDTITNLGDPINDGDALNLKYFDANRTRYYSVNDGGTIGGNYNNDGATGLSAIASGVNATASGDGSVAMGFGASAPIRDSLALGSGSVVDRALAPDSGFIPAGSATIEYNTTDKELLGAISVGDDDSYRQITNVADGTEAQDAVTVRQLQGAVGSVITTGIKYYRANSDDPDAIASGEDSLAIGPNTVTNGDNGIGMGNGAIVGQMAPGGTAIGNNAEVMLSDGIALGTNAHSEAQQGIALGAGATVSHDQSVALGSNSVTEDAVATSGVTIAGDSYTFAGTTPDSTVSIGSAGNERTLTNVAAGRVSETSTDAINGSQLFASNQAIEEVSTIANTGWDLQTNGDAATNVAPGDTVQMIDGQNIAITGNGTDITVATADDVVFDSVMITDGPTLTDGGVDMDASTISNLADGVNAQDAVNLSQLQNSAAASKTEVAGGTNVTSVDQTIGADGQAIYTVNADSASVSAGSGAVDVTAAAPDANNVTDYAVDLSQASKDSLTLADSALQTVVTQIDGTEVKTLDQNDNVANFISGQNIELSDDGGAIEIATSSNLTADSLTINNGPTLNGNGIDMGGNSITNLGDPVNDGDALNLQYFNENRVRYFSVNDNGVIGGNFNNDGATGLNAMASGVGAIANGEGAVAMGFGANALVRGSLAIGSGSISDRALAPESGFIPAGSATIEYNTTDKELLGAISVGDSDSYRQIINVADGTEAQDAVTVRQLQGAIGSVVNTGTKYFHANSTAPDSLAAGNDSIAVGPTTVTNGDNGIGMGNGAIVGQMAPGGTAIGNNAEVLLSDGVAFGTNARSEAQQGIALGAGATVSHDQSVALGSNSVTEDAVATSGVTIAGDSYTFAGTTPDSTVSIGSAGNERTLTNVAAGRVSETSTDAINGSQLFASNQAIEEVSAAANAGWNVTDGTNAANIGPNGEVTFTGDSNLTVAQTGIDDAGEVEITLNRDLDLDSVTAGNSELTSAGLSVDDGNGNLTTVTNDGLTIAGGPSITASGGIDANNQVISNVGTPVDDGDALNLQYFNENRARYYSVNDGGTVGGNFNNDGATGLNAIASGVDASASGEGAVAMGFGANAPIRDSLALGSGSISDRALAPESGFIPVGSATIEYNTTDKELLGAISVGDSDSYRQIINVADGTEAQDAVTVRQLQGAIGSVVATGTKYFHANSTAPDSLAAGNDSIAVGPATVTNGDNGIGIGNGAIVGQLAPGGTAIGDSAEVLLEDGIAFGTEARSEAQQGIALGAGATVSHDQSVALGSNSTTDESVATQGITLIGNDYSFAGTTPTSTVSVGSVGNERTITNVAAGRVSATSTDAINGSQLFASNQAIEEVSATANAGWNLSVEDGEANNVAPTGEVNLLSDDGNILITQATVNDREEVAFGLSADLSIANSLTVGQDGPVISNEGITNLAEGDVSADSKDAINGSQLYATNQWVEVLENSVTNVVGDGSDEYITNNGRGIRYVRTNDSGLAVSDAFAQGQGSTAVGYEAVASADRALAMGYDAIASHQGSVALGEGARTAAAVGTASVEIAGQTYQFAGSAPVATVSVGSVGAERTVTSVAAGRISAESTDAINGSQLYATNQAVGALDNRVTTVEGDISNITNDLADLDDRAVKYDRNDDGSVDYSTITLEGDGGTKITNVAPGDIAQNSSDAVNGSQLWDVQNQITNIEQGGSKYFRANSDGPAAAPQGADSIAMGPSSVAAGDRSVASGAGAQANAEGSVALGADSVADREGMNGERERFSNESVASTQGAVSVGSEGNERQITNVAGGTRDTDAVNVRQLDAVQRGAVNYDRDEDGNVDYSTITLKGDEGTTITNVAPGVNETDAVNVGQMNELGRRFENEINNVHGRIDSVERNANAGSASAIAASTVPQAWMPGKSMIGVGAGTYGGESAVSVGISRLSDNGRWVIQGKVTGDSQSNFGAGIGAGWHW